MSEDQTTSETQPATHGPAKGSVLGFDFGLKRVGVAVGELELATTHPLETLTEESSDKRFAAIGKLIEEWRPVLLVVGVPAYPDGNVHPLAETCRRFARRLQGRFNLPVALVDERYTSAAASNALREAGVKGRKQKPMLDQVAAQQILETYFSLHTADRK